MVGDKKVFKILITGSFGSGKTTFVKTLSEIDPLLTEKNISLPERRSENKQTTTVAMDMGKLKIGDDIEVHLFSTPGQERFEFMFDILSKGILGAIILVDATSEESIAVAEDLAKKIRERFDIPILYAVTKLDMPNAKSLEEIKAFLSSIEGVAVEPLDPRDKESGKEVLVKLLSMMV